MNKTKRGGEKPYTDNDINNTHFTDKYKKKQAQQGKQKNRIATQISK